MINKTLISMSICLCLSLPAFAAERGQTSFALKIPATEEAPTPSNFCTFGSTEDIAELSQATYDTDNSGGNEDFFSYILFGQFKLQMTVPSGITRVILGVDYFDGQTFQSFGHPDTVFTDGDGNAYSHNLNPVFWDSRLTSSNDRHWAYSAPLNAVILSPTWHGRTIDYIVPALSVSSDGASLPKPDATKTWTSNPIYITCYGG